MIPQRNLSMLANRLAKGGGRRIPEAVLERDYCLAWFLVGLSRNKLKDRLAFKGGTAIKRCYIGDYRFSEDLDFTLIQECPFEIIRQELEPVFNEIKKASGIVFRYVRQDRHSHENSYTFYISYEGPLPVTAGGKEVKVDITIKEKIVFDIESRDVLMGYREYEDIPPNSKINVYSLHEIAVEKTLALLDRARNEPRDLYDVWRLIQEGHYDGTHLLDAIHQKLEFRGKKLADVKGEFRAKEARYKKLWNLRLSSQMTKLPEIEGVYRIVKRTFRQAGLT